MSLFPNTPATIKKILNKKHPTPFDRHLLVIADIASRERDGKILLNDEARQSIINNWEPTDADEVREYNNYNKAWRLLMTAETEAKTFLLEAKSTLQELALFITSIKSGALEPFSFMEEPYSSIKIDKDTAEPIIKEILQQVIKKLTDLYAKLLEFKTLFDRASEIYGVNLSYKLKQYTDKTESLINALKGVPFSEYGPPDIHTSKIEPKAGSASLYKANIFPLYGPSAVYKKHKTEN